MTAGTGTATSRLAEFAVRTGYADIPDGVVHEAERLVLDIVGCAVAGSTTVIGDIVRAFAADIGGGAVSSVLARQGGRQSPPLAAFSNGSAANALDMDDSFFNFAHPGTVVVVAALAMAEKLGSSGSDLLAAVAVGYDIACRVGLSSESHGLLRKGSISSVSWQTFGAAAACARLIGLDETRMANALGVAGCYAPIPSQAAYEADPAALPLTKYFPAGWSAQAGLTAAMLAAGGMTGPSSILDGETGFWRMQGFETSDPESMSAELGTRWWINDVAYKPWPSCRATHHYLTTFARILAEHRIDPYDIRSVVVHGHFDPTNAPAQRKFTIRHPDSLVNQQFSLPFGLANLAFGIPPGPSWYREPVLTGAAFREFREKVTIVTDPAAVDSMRRQLAGSSPRRVTRLGGAVEVRTAAASFTDVVDYARGDPWGDGSALTDRDLIEKFRQNLRSAERLGPDPSSDVDVLAAALLDLRSLPDTRELQTLLARL